MSRLYEKRAEISNQKLMEKQKKEYEESVKNAVSYEEYCRMNGKDIKKSPLEKLKSKLEKESKRNTDGGRKQDGRGMAQ